MRRKLTTLLMVCLFWHTAYSQCDDPNPAVDQCDAAVAFCDGQIDGFCSTLPQFSTGFPGGTLCQNGGSPHNNEWMAFAAGSTQISIQVDISNCTSVPCGGGTCTGLQAGIYDDCLLSMEMDCEGNCNDTQITLTSAAFEIGQVYYLFMDGCAGSVCDYELTVLQGITTAPPPGPHTTPMGTTVVCENGEGMYSIPAVPNASEYDWTLPPGATISQGTNNEIVVTFGSSGGQVCVQAYNECYPALLPPLCMNVQMVPPAVSTLNETYCTGSSYFYEGDGQNYIDLGFPYSITLPIPSWRGCDSIVSLNVMAVPLPPESITDYVCEGDVYTYEGNGQDYFPGFNDILLPQGSFRGCDSTVYLDLIQTPDAFHSIEVAICEGDVYEACGTNFSLTSFYTLETNICGNSFQGCDSTIYLDLTVLNPESVISVDAPGVIGCDGAGIVLHGLSSNFATETYEWTSPDITADICSGDPFSSVIQVCTPATYCLTTTMSHTTINGVLTTCSDMVCVDVTEDVIAPELTASATDVGCNGATDGTVQVTASNTMVGPFTYLWSPGGAETSSVSSLPADVYTVTVTGSNGCTAIETVTIGEPVAITGMTVSQAINCNGANDGTATVTPAGGSGDYTYLWCNGQTSSTATGLNPGICSVTITDGNMCIGVEQVDIAEPTIVDLATAHTNITCNGAANGTASVTAAGGEGTYIYLWCNGQTDANAMGLPAGLCTVTVTDGNGCQTQASVNILEPTVVAIQVDNTNVSCSGLSDATATANPSGGAGDYTYMWCNGQTGAVATGLPAGPCSVTVTDGNNCFEVESVMIDENAALALDIAGNPVSCNGIADGTATVTPAGGNGDYTYIWCNGQTNANANGLPAGNCFVTVTDGNGCSDMISILINEPVLVTAVADFEAVSCNGGADGEATVTASGGDDDFSYVWCNGQTSATATGLSVGICAVTVTDGNGCSEVTSVDVTQPVPVGAVADFEPVSCNGGTDGEATVVGSGGSGDYTYLWCNGQTTETATGLPVGICIVTVTDMNDCSQTTSVDLTEPQAVQASTDFEAVSCNGASDGEATVIASGGSGDYTYLWCNGQTTETATGLPVGICMVTVTDINGCMELADVDVTQPAPMGVQTDSDDVSCNGASDGEATVIASGGSGDYNYLWCNGQTSANATGLPAGSCSVTITDTNGCSQIESINLSEPQAITINVDGVDVSCNNGSDGEATAMADGGDGDYSYLWCNGQTGSTATGLPVGSCTVTITDGNGCSEVESIVLTEPTAVTAVLSTEAISCNGGSDGEASVTPDGGSGDYTYIWCNGQTTETATGLPVGTCSVTVSDVNGCMTIESINVPEPAIIDLAIDGVNVNCNGASNGEATVTAVGGDENYTYLWCNGQEDDTATGLPAGICMVTVTDGNGCFDVIDIDLTEPAPLNLFMTPEDVSCNGASDGEANVSVSGGGGTYTYLWCNGQEDDTATGLPAGECSVTVSDQNGCTDVMMVMIDEPAAVDLAIDGTNISCNGAADGTATVSADGGAGGFTYVWCNGQTDPTATSLPAGICVVTVMDGNGCTQDININITQPAALNVSALTTNVSCNGGLDGEAVITTTGGTGDYTYQWCNGNNGSSITGLAAGTCSVEVSDENGCSEIIEIILTEPAVLELDLSQDDVSCNQGSNGEAMVVPTGGNGDYTYLWSNGEETEMATGLPAGQVDVTVTDSEGCFEIGSVLLTEPVALSLSTNATDLNCNESLDGTATVAPSGGTGDYTYLWCDGQETATAEGLAAGTCEVTVTDENGCQEIATIQLTEPQAIELSTNIENASCTDALNGSATVMAIGGTGDYTYTWSDENDQFTPTATSLGAGNYVVTVMDANGCMATEMVMITQPLAPLDADGISTPATCAVDNGTIALDVSGGTGDYTYEWNLPALNGQQNPSDLGPGLYTVTITDENGCQEILDVNVDTPSGLAVTPAADMVTCNNGMNGTVNLDIVGGSTPYGIVWDIPGFDDMPVLTSLPAGVYNATITDADDCILTVSATVDEPQELDILVDASQASCGGSDGMISVNVTGGTGDYSFVWDNAPNVEDPTGLSAGLYNVTVTDENNCMILASTEITVPNAPAIDFVNQNVSCNGGSDGNIELTINGGQEPYDYFWSDASLNGVPNPAGLPAGMYIVTVVDVNNCEAIMSVDVTEPIILDVIPQTTAISCNGGADGTAMVMVSGGTGDYTYNWCDGQTTSNVNGLSAGSCSVTVSDENGCSQIMVLDLAEPMVISSQLATDDAECNGQSSGVIDIQVAGGTGPYSFTWSEAGLNPDAVGAGSYDVTITDINNCTSTINSIIIDEPQLLVVDGTTTAAVCGESNGSISLSVTGGNPPYVYNWVDPALMGGAPTELAPGSYDVVVVDGNDCSVNSTWNVDTPSGLAIDQTTGNDATCNGGADGSIVLDISGGGGNYTFDWNVNDLDGFQNPTGLVAGDYIVTITDADDCSLTASVSIAEPSPVVASGTSIDATCGSSNGSIDLNVQGGAGNYSYNWDAAMNVQDPTGLPPGTYNVTVTDINGCEGTASVTVQTPSGLAATAASEMVSCSGGADGTVNLDIVGGTLPYTFDWSDDQYDGMQNLTGVSAGTLSVTITDGDDCEIINSIDVQQPTALVATNIVTDASCSNNDGAINVVIDGGTGTVSYAWSDGSIGDIQDPAGLSAGDYILTVTDANGCTAMTNATITIPDAPAAMISGIGVQCFSGTDGSINIDINGGQAPYTYTWSDASIGDVQNPTGLIAGIYDVTISDINACTAVETVTITEPDELVLSAVPTDALCGEANGSIALDVIGGTGSYTFDWDNSANDVQNPTDLSPGTYAVTVMDSNGCISTTDAVVSTPTGLALSAIPSPTNCNGSADGSIAVDVNGGTPGYIYAWSDASIGDVQNPTGLPAGTYTVTITDLDGCTTSEVAIVDEPTVVTASGISTDALCGESNGTIDLTVNGGTGTYTYLWDNGAGTSEDPIDLAAGNYNVTITDGNNCTSTSMVAVNTPNQLSLDYQATNVSCNGDTDGSIDITVSGGVGPFSFDWNINTLDDIEDPTNLGSGLYIVTVTDSEGCEFFNTIDLTEPAALTASADDASTNCNGGNDGTITVVPGGGSGTYNYQWSVAGVGNSDMATGLNVGNYEVTITDGNGCTTITAASVSEPLAMSASAAGQTTSCFGVADGAINLLVAGGTGPYDFDWNDNALDGIEDPVDVGAGFYTVVISDVNGCTLTETVVVDQPNALNLATAEVSDYGGFNLTCADATDGFIQVSGSGGVAPYTYLWTNGETTSRIEDLPAGIYEVVMTDASGCTTPQQVSLQAPMPINTTFSILDPDCLGENTGAILIDTVIGGTAPYLYAIDNGVLGTLDQFSRLIQGEYNLNIEDANGCEWTETLTVNDGFELDVWITDDTGDTNNENVNVDIQLTANPLDSVLLIGMANVAFSNLDTFFWGELPNCLDNCAEQFVLPTDRTIYSFTAIDENGCTDTDELIFNIRKDRLIYIPNAFSPNGDENNQRFMIYGGVGVKHIESFLVFNRWGEVVFDGTLGHPNFQPDDTEHGWDGTFKNKVLNPAVFVYYAKVVFDDGHVEIYQGDVTLMH